MTQPRATDSLTVTPVPREVMTPRERTGGFGTGSPPSPISAVGLVNVLLRHRVMILLLTLASGGFAGFKSFTSARSYTAEAQFMPKGARGQSQLGGLAAQFGVSLGGDASQSPQLYTDLLRTRRLLWPVAQKTYTVPTASGMVTGDIMRVFQIQGRNAAVIRTRAITRLQIAIRSSLAQKTGIISLFVTTFSPELSLQIAQNLLDQVNVYNLATRQAQAAAEREFAERQVGEKQAELRAAEQMLENFLESNRQYRSSPQLTLEYGRLQRRVDMRSQIYTSLLQGYEAARIEEVKDLPVINIIEPPELPLDPDMRGGARKTLIGLIIGLVLGIVLAFLSDRLRVNRESQSDDFLEFSELRRAAIGDLTHPWRPLTRVLGSRRKK